MKTKSPCFRTAIGIVLGCLAGVASAVGAEAAPPGPRPGQIVIDPEHPQWLMRHGGKHLFLCGPGDPEEFLYLGTRNPDGTRDGDQVQRIRKLIEHGGNCIYMQIVRTHGGDAKGDRTHNPFIGSDPAKGLDPDILNQWEEWFTLMDRHNILIYLFFYDDSARIWNTGDLVGPEEKAFVETIVKKFKHHRNLIWVVGEESEERYTTARVQALAEAIRRADDRGHLIGNHHHSGTTFKAWREGGALNHFSMQLSATDDAAHAGAIEALQKAAGRYQVIYSESTAMRTDEEWMRRHAWAVAMGGLMPMLLRMDIASTPVESLRQCRYLQRFFEATDFFRMASHDELRHGETRYVLADPGRSYIAYADNLAGPLGVKALPAGRCAVTWLDCISGRTVEEQHTLARAGDHAFLKPSGFGPECAAWIRFPDVKVSSVARTVSTPAERAPAQNQPPVVENQRLQTRPGAALYVQLKFADDDGPGPYSYTIVNPPAHGTLSGDDNDRVYTPKPGFPGTDRFTWKVHDGVAESETATVMITVTDIQ
ncbi:MAG: hypothetical protein FJ280_05075 [Planctomycetes bacterium]|nr:hypothetical protein [Planctomycetota bacterium]